MKTLKLSILILLFFITSLYGEGTVPFPLLPQIDDTGWKHSNLYEDLNTPYLNGVKWPLGVDREMNFLEDYAVIKYVAENVGARIPCYFIMSEFDRSNICASYPTTTEYGVAWNNTSNVSDDDFVIMDYVKENACYLEFGMHGVRHEHWESSTTIKRAEYYNMEDRVTWPYADSKEHADCFKELIEQYDIDFPKSFVPPAHAYYYNPSTNTDTAALMKTYGVKYIASNFNVVSHLNPPLEDGGGLDNGILWLNRAELGIGWNDLAANPNQFPFTVFGESHWTNWLATNPQDNIILVAPNWIGWFNQIKDMPGRYVPKNSAQACSQWLYYKYANISQEGTTVTIDNQNMPDEVYQYDLLGNLVFKVPLPLGKHVCYAKLNDKEIACYYEDRNYGYIILPILEKNVYTLTYIVGNDEMLAYVLNDGTYNILSFQKGDDLKIDVQMYGKQDVKIKIPSKNIHSVVSNNPNLVINNYNYAADQNLLTINIESLKVQGAQGTVTITFTGKEQDAKADVYNNLFNPLKGEKAAILVDVPEEGQVKIYNIVGELIKELSFSSGENLIYWDGKNQDNQIVASGVYIALIKTDDFKKTAKICILK